MSHSLFVPLKKTDPLDIVRILSNYIKNNFPDNIYEKSRCSIESLNELRNTLLCKPIDKHEASLDAYVRYYQQIEKLDSKIQISESQANLKFTWYDCFDKVFLFGPSKCSLYKASFERICVLFNIGALSSQIASVQPTSKSDSLKQMARYYQLASGVFKFLMDTIPRDITMLPTQDMSAECLLCLSSIMLAQAQESYYMKACLDNMKQGTLAKISMQLSDCFKDALLKLHGGSLKNNWFLEAEKILNVKSLYYRAMADFHQSIIEKEEKKIENNICRLEKAASIIQEMIKKGVLSELKSNSDKILSAYNSAKKENDTVYLLRIPKHDQLTPIGKALLAKEIVPTPENISPCHAKNFLDLFDCIVPLHISEFCKYFKDYKKIYIQNQINLIRDQINFINSVLASLNLPASIESFGNSNVVPQSIIDKCNKVRQIGGEVAFIAAIENLRNHFTNNSNILNEVVSKLDSEESEDKDLRAKFGSSWRRTTSVELTKEVREEIDRYKKYLVSANKADDLVRNRFSTFRHGITELSLDPNNLIKLIPNSTVPNAKFNSSITEKLKNIIDSLNSIISKREQIIKRFNEHSFDVVEVAMNKYDSDDKKLTADNILDQQYGMLIESEKKLSAEQDSLCKDLQDENKKFVEAVGLKEGEREIKLKQLAESFDVFIQLQAHLSEGQKFYNDLNEALLKISNKVNDFICARQMEKNEYLREAQSTYSSQNQPYQAIFQNYNYSGNHPSYSNMSNNRNQFY